MAAVPGLLGYTGMFETIVPAATIAFFILSGFSVVSFLLCLFEDEPERAVVTSQLKATPLRLDVAEAARVAP